MDYVKGGKMLQKRKRNSFATQQKKEKKKTKRLLFLLIFLILLGMLVGVSLAKCEVQIQGQAFANIAKPILEIRKEQSLFITAQSPRAVYEFEIRNYQEEEVNQVEMEYYLEIVTPKNEAIHFTLYQGETQIPLVENKTEKIKLEKEEKQIHSYRLEIHYDQTKQNTQQDIVQNVEIKIHSIQKA